jgi:hypothetical protein
VSGSITMRLDFGLQLQADAEASRAVGEILTRPCFSALERISGRHKDRWSKHAKPTAKLVAEYLANPAFDAVHFDTKREDELAASAEIESDLAGRETAPAETAMQGYLVIPYVDADLDAVRSSVLDLANVLQVGAGFLALEPDYRAGKRMALSSSRPKERAGLAGTRQLGRFGRLWKRELIATHLATVEWGTLLGAGHLDRIDLAKVRASGAFERVVEVSPRLAFLQVTGDPRDDLSGELEAKLPAARDALAPLLMDISDVNLD